ncbi:MAG: ATP-binding cassette domain-containing protein [Rhizobiaceae bacterium]
MAIVFHEPALLSWQSVLHSITLIRKTLNDSTATHALERVSIANKAPMFTNQLSLGQQRRLALAWTFAGKPDALIMAEPFVSLDTGTANEMLSLTEQLIAETSLAKIAVTHAAHEAKDRRPEFQAWQGTPPPPRRCHEDFHSHHCNSIPLRRFVQCPRIRFRRNPVEVKQARFTGAHPLIG